MRFLGTNPELRQTRVEDGQTLGGLIDRQVQIGLAGAGKPSERAFVPQTPAAVTLLAGERGARIERILRGALSSIDAVAGAAELSGITLSTGQQGFAANRLMTMMDMQHERLPKAPSTAGWRRELASTLKRVRTEGEESGVLAQDMSWMDFGPFASRALLRTAADGRHARSDEFQATAAIAVHELQHALTRARDADLVDDRGIRQLNWLEEGVADAMTWQPPALKRMTAAMGVQYRPTNMDEQIGYPAFRGGVEHLLKLAGIDPATDPGYDRAFQLLQGGALSRTPGRLADAIVEHRGIAPEHREALRKLIVEVPGPQRAMNHPHYDHFKAEIFRRNLAAIDSFVKEHAADAPKEPVAS